MDENQTNNEYVEENVNTENSTNEQPMEGVVQDSPEAIKEDKEKNKGMAVLCYLGILVLIPYLTVKDSKWVRFNAIQGMNLLIVELIGIVFGFIPVLGTLVYWVVTLYSLIVSIMGIVNVCNGEEKELPLMNYFKFIKE